MIIGTAASSPSAPEATSPTITEVLAEEDCTNTVPSRPMKRPAIGCDTFENRRS